METTPCSKLYSKFSDDKEIACRIYDMLANDILGKEQMEKIKLRYDDMYRNFFNYSKDEAQKLGLKDAIWEFSSGVEPFTPTGWNRYYEDTITVPIPITHPDFKDLTTRTEKRGAIGLDLPTWFNLKNNDKRIMLVAQDPLRDNTWYSDIDKFPKGKTGCKEDYICIDALVASPFGLHGKSWRDKKNKVGGIKRMEVAEWHYLSKSLSNTVMAFTLPTAGNILYMTIGNPPSTLKRRKTYTRLFCKKR